MLPSIQQQPPFRLPDSLDPQTTGLAITNSIAYFSSIDTPLTIAFSSAMQLVSMSVDEPLYRAGLMLARDIDAGVGCGSGNAYHNTAHFCEVLLCAIAIAALAEVSDREHAIIYLAAIAHDFHHDGLPNREPYRLEKLAVEKLQPYLIEAGVAEEDRHALAAMILSTETGSGVAFARACYEAHFQEMRPVSTVAPQQALMPLLDQPRLAIMAVILCEADILPSVGLTVSHAEVTAARLEAEWGTTLDADSKIAFIDHFVGDLRVARYFKPNVDQVRKAFKEQNPDSKT